MAPDEPWTHHEAIVNDVRLHYVAAGPEDGNLVVLLHGFPEFWYSWHHQLPALADAGYRVLAPDLRGYNRSEKPPGVVSYRTAELVGDAVGLIEHAGREDSFVVGHDWGGAVAWALAIGRPDLVDRLAILNSPHPGAFQRELTSNLDQLRRSWYMFAFQVPWLPETLLSWNDAALLDRLFDPGEHGRLSPAEMRRYREAFSRPGAARAAINYYRATIRSMLRGLLGGGGDPGDLDVSVPTLVLWGMRDEALSPELLDGLDRWVPDLEMQRFPEASHWLQLDEPEAVNEALVEFFA